MGTITLFRPYCSLEEVQHFMGQTKADDVDTILSAINRASRFIDSKTRWIFYRKQYTDELVINTQGSPGNWTVWDSVNSVRSGFIKAPFKPILNFALTSHDGSSAPSVLVEGTDYQVDYINGRVYCLGYGWSMKAGAYTVTAQVGVDNGTEDLTKTPITDYNETVPADEEHGMDGEIHQFAIQIAATYTGLWMKKVYVQGMMQPENRLINVVDKETLKALSIWAVKA